MTFLDLTTHVGRFVLDEDMATISRLSKLQSLALVRAAITAVGAEQISRLTKLTSLNVSSCTHIKIQCLKFWRVLPLQYLFCDFKPKLVADIDGALSLAVLRTWRGNRTDHEMWQI